MDGIRLATTAEVEAMAATSDLTPQSSVFAWDNASGPPDFAVMRSVLELDPVLFSPESNTRRRATFIWALENGMRMNGVSHYYFQVPTTDPEWIKVVEGFGAESVSVAPEWRYKRVFAAPKES